MWRWAPPIRYTLQRNTASIMKGSQIFTFPFLGLNNTTRINHWYRFVLTRLNKITGLMLFQGRFSMALLFTCTCFSKWQYFFYVDKNNDLARVLLVPVKKVRFTGRDTTQSDVGNLREWSLNVTHSK